MGRAKHADKRDGTDGVTESYIYDANGQRVSRTRPVTGGGSVTTLYFGLHEEEISSSQSTTRTLYSFGGCTVQRTAVTVSSTTITTLAYLHGDHLGSVSLTTDASGAVTSQQSYDVWGKVRGTAGGTSPTTMNYTGQKRDDTGLLFYNARYYDPGIGRFLSADSIAIGKDSQSRNRYTYVGNNPINATDPTGHCAYVTTDEGSDRDPNDAKCWAAYDEVAGRIGYAPGGLDGWDLSKLNDLLKWMRLGIRFVTGNTFWTAAQLDTVREAFDRIYNFIGKAWSRYNLPESYILRWMKLMFGLDRGLAFVSRMAGGEKDGLQDNGGRTCYIGCKEFGVDYGNSIIVWQGTADIQTIIHELGHLLDWNAARRITLPSGNTLPYGQTWSEFGEFARFHQNKKGAVSESGTHPDTREDFAETFAYLVQTANEKDFIIAAPNPTDRTRTSPDVYRQCAVYDAMISALGGFNSQQCGG